MALSETSLALVATLLVVVESPSSPNLTASTGNEAVVNTSFVSVAPSQGQAPFPQLNGREPDEGDAVETQPETPVAQNAAASPWSRFVRGVDEVIEQIRRENRDGRFGEDEPAGTGESPPDDREEPARIGAPAARETQTEVPRRSWTEGEQRANRLAVEAVDEAIDALGDAIRSDSQSGHLPALELPEEAPWFESLPPDPPSMRLL